MPQGGRASSMSTLHSHLWKFFITTQRDVNASRRQGIKHVYTTLLLVEVLHHHPKRCECHKEAGHQACLHYTPTLEVLHHHPKRCKCLKEAGHQACLHYTPTHHPKICQCLKEAGHQACLHYTPTCGSSSIAH